MRRCERVVILLKEATTIHTDLDGIARIPFRDSVEHETRKIRRELVKAGLLVD
jgi:predicted nucleotide-binding protein